jgi:hypothetical protein
LALAIKFEDAFADRHRDRSHCADRAATSTRTLHHSWKCSSLSVTAVPEPGEWAVIMGGLLGVFAVVRCRRTASVR